MTVTSEATFPKSKRLLNAKDYSDVFDGVDIKISTQYFLCLAKKRSTPAPCRLGIIVAKKNVRLAVKRNRIKRLLRENFRLSTTQLPQYDLVMMAKRNSGETESAKLSKELQYIWRKLKQRAKS